MNLNASTTTLSRQDLVMQMMPIWLCFISLGIIWSPEIIIGYISSDLELSNIQVLLLNLPYFICLLLLPLPETMLIRRVGHKNVIMSSLLLWIMALVILASDLYYTYPIMVAAFFLMAIATTLMLTSLYSLIATLNSNETLPSALAFVQTLVPLAAAAVPLLFDGANKVTIPTFGFGWRIIFVLFAIIAMFAFSVLGATPHNSFQDDEANLFKDIKTLLASGTVRRGILATGFIAGTNFIALLLTINVTSFLIFQAIGLFIGGMLLRNVSPLKLSYPAIAIQLLGIILLWIGGSDFTADLSFVLIGFSNAPLFAIVLSLIFTKHPNNKYAVTALAVTAISIGVLLLTVATLTTGSFGETVAYLILSASTLLIMGCLVIEKFSESEPR
ncbi:MAG: MFS transporter [Muribaculaceae bacterium]|nr:MFS transporter [Muribaculaceae bacterium]